ncbi:hypothetical protein TWF506_001663 [Arthrobotrys conoides]|uniref:Reverse transcriptase domain-containing protein n=1 Tax=Arthrobotrys conoides TaxID=74498 RepID=A0AAN8NXZ3_9PEZI
MTSQAFAVRRVSFAQFELTKTPKSIIRSKKCLLNFPSYSGINTISPLRPGAVSLSSTGSTQKQQSQHTIINQKREFHSNHNHKSPKSLLKISSLLFTSKRLASTLAMASSDGLSETLHAVTRIKLDQLAKQTGSYESAKRSLLEDADAEIDSRKRTRLLINGAENLPTMTSLKQNPTVPLQNVRKFTLQSERDPSVSEGFLEDYEKMIRDELDVQSNKYSFAMLYGQLVNEWISVGKKGNGEGSEAGADWVPVGREEMHKQRATWEDYVFTEKKVDTEAIKAYLEDLFTNNPSKEVRLAFEDFRDKMKNLQKHWNNSPFDVTTVSSTIKTLLRIDVINDKKKSTLKGFLGNDVVLKEIADVLNMRMASRKSFTWEGVSVVEQRRQLNGRYRFFPDEDLLQTIFIQYTGLRWATQLRASLKQFITTYNVLKSVPGSITEEQLQDRNMKLGMKVRNKHTLEKYLTDHWMDEIFLDQLPEDMFEQRGGYSSDSQEGDTRSSSLAVVQKLLRIVQSEIIIRRKLEKDTTVIRSDFKWFGPSIPHASIFAVLEFFGVEEDWIQFFRKILEAPITFIEDIDASPRPRQRGIPIGVPIANFFGEALLFCTDFAVNQKANGARLYRLFDDIWMWGGKDTCSKGWSALTEFAALTGLEFNEEKTGSVHIYSDRNKKVETHHAGLPGGDVIWGFLKLDPVSGFFTINTAKVDSHIEELSLQLNACKSVFDFTQAWNIYGARFFRTNCGKASVCFGRQHVDSMLETFQRIQQKIFKSATGGVGEHLKQMIVDRFGVTDIPDGYLYFPVKLGGLELQNPFVDLYLIRDSFHQDDPYQLMDEFFKAEDREYSRQKERFESRKKAGDAKAAKLQGLEFLSREEYGSYREETSYELLETFRLLTDEPLEIGVDLNGEVRAGLNISVVGGSKGRDQWKNYDKWIFQLYAKEMMKRFGGLKIVDEGLLPMGLMAMLRQSRFKWQG